MAIVEPLSETEAALSNGGLSNGDPLSNNGENNKKSRYTKRRRRRRKQKKNNKKPSADEAESEAAAADEYKYNNSKINESVEVEYITEKVEETFLEEFRGVLEKFNFSNSEAAAEDDEEEKEKGVSNMKKKLQRRMKIAELIQISSRPDIVEVCDATAADPKLLVFLKSYRNTVPVPRHWCQKRKFLQGRRGIEKQPYQLPDFIAATRIEKMRQAYLEKEDSKTLKAVVNYLVLHDAFFKYQTKPNLTTHGDLYHEGKEFEVKLREMKPDMLSHELKEALGMLDGAPSPWLINMQRYGPPPSYPHLKIPGLNAPIPPGASFGYHPGGWGKPPVDEFGSPLYGDVFGVQQKDQPNYEEEPVDRSKHWGDLEEEEEEEEEMEAGMQSVDSLSSIPTGVETPDVIELRKQQRKEPEKSLCQVLEKKEEKIAPGTLLGTTHSYNLPAQDKTATKRVDLPRGQKSDTADVTIQPEDTEVLDVVLAAKYEEARKEEWLKNQKADFGDKFAEFDRDIVIEGAVGSKRKSKLTVQRKGKKSRSEDIVEGIDKFSCCRVKYINHFLKKMHIYIWSVIDTSNDGHSGFNALARHLGYFHNDGWRQVREELYQELETRLPFYTKILGEEIVARLLTSIPCTEAVTSKDHYMYVPHVAFLFANRYMIPIVLLSKTMNYTFFPMCAPPADHRETTLCAIGYVGKHFVIPRLIDHSPIPPPHEIWYQHKPADAIAWTTPYLDAICAYKKMMKIKSPLLMFKDYYDVFTD